MLFYAVVGVEGLGVLLPSAALGQPLPAQGSVLAFPCQGHRGENPPRFLVTAVWPLWLGDQKIPCRTCPPGVAWDSFALG